MSSSVSTAALTKQLAVDSPGLFFSSSLLGLLIFVLDLFAVFQVFQSNKPALHKVLWAFLIFLCPIVGILIYYLVERRNRRRLRYISIP